MIILARTLHSEDLFDRLQNENERKARMIEISKNPDLKSICESYETCLKYGGLGTETLYSIAETTNNKATSGQIRDFSLLLSNYQDHKNFDYSGIFLSYLINNSEDRNFSIITLGLGKLVNYIGLFNVKNILIRGNVGNFFGKKMNGGRIHVKGNAGHDVGYCMTNGEIYIDGDVTGNVGASNMGGNIYINGNVYLNYVQNSIGLNMQKGKIQIKGVIERK